VAVVAVPDIVKTRRYYVDCERQGMYTRGHTFVAKNELLIRKGQKPELCDVALELDLPRFRQFLRAAVAHSAGERAGQATG
jgi:inosine-uridine nucleoside N-ribohydrolase